MEEIEKGRSIERYNGNQYRLSFKLKVLDDLIASQERDSFVARKHSIPHASLFTIRRNALEKLGYYRILNEMKEKRQSEKLSQEEEIVELKEALKLATMKVAALETLIDVAEDQLNVDIRKKAGSKQSK